MHIQRELDRRPQATLPRESLGELLSELAENSASLFRDELELAKQEMRENVGLLRSGILTVGVGAVVGFTALLTLTAAAVIGLARFVGAGNSALIIGAVLAVIGVITALAGVRTIKRTSLKPEQTIETLEEDKEWLKQLM